MNKEFKGLEDINEECVCPYCNKTCFKELFKEPCRLLKQEDQRAEEIWMGRGR